MNFLHPVYDPIRWIAVEFILKFYHILYWHLSLSYNTVFWFGPIYMYVPYSWVRIIEQKLWVISCFLFQLYDFSAPNECPCAISYHPSRQIFACGFESGVVRVFNVQTTSMLAEHKYAKFYPWSWKKPTLFNKCTLTCTWTTILMVSLLKLMNWIFWQKNNTGLKYIWSTYTYRYSLIKCTVLSETYLFKTWWCLGYRQHRGKIIGLAFSPVGDYLYSACSLGSLSLYDAESDRYTLLRLLANTVVRTDRLGPEAIAVSPDGRRVAFIGPSEFTVCVVDAKSLSEVSWILLFNPNIQKILM